MKKIYLLLTMLLVGVSSQASPAAQTNFGHSAYQDAFIFIERGVEFAIFPDGQFDFFFNPQGNFNRVSPHVNYSYNAGYNYGPFVQYDDYGAVIQIENVPVYYDYYGRIVQAGRVQIRYNAFGMVNRVGNLLVHYDPYHRYSHTSGFINNTNIRYVYRPWHDYYMRPHANFTVVYNQPYRLHYEPYRMKYNAYKKYYHKNQFNKGSFQKSYYKPGDRVTSYHRGRRTEEQKQTRMQNANSAKATVAVPQAKNDYRETQRTSVERERAAESTRTSRAKAPAVQQPEMRKSRTENRAVRSAERTRSNTSVNAAPQRSVQTQNRTRRSATVNPSAEVQAPARSPESRSSRGRN
jgi:hypothetical protein